MEVAKFIALGVGRIGFVIITFEHIGLLMMHFDLLKWKNLNDIYENIKIICKCYFRYCLKLLCFECFGFVSAMSLFYSTKLLLTMLKKNN
uniref:Uncharacterized protein n=1 Tax=viral metagenome TaxID=1070528 RepID=A0A6C0H5B1_9ZZZZ